MCDNETTLMILVGKIRPNGVLAGKKRRYILGHRDLTTNWTNSNNNKSTWFQQQFITTSFVISDVIMDVINNV